MCNGFRFTIQLPKLRDMRRELDMLSTAQRSALVRLNWCGLGQVPEQRIFAV
jgi:hypothetical protein